MVDRPSAGRPIALALSIGGLAAPILPATQAPEKPTETATWPAANAAAKMGYAPGERLTPEQQKTVDGRKGKIMDGGNGMVDFKKVAKSLSHEERLTIEVAMAHGLTPIIVKGKIMGYDDPIQDMDWLPDAVAKHFASEVKTAGNAARKEQRHSGKKEPEASGPESPLHQHEQYGSLDLLKK